MKNIFRRGPKGQVSVEYLIIVALAMAIIVPGAVLFYNYANESNEKISASQINKIGKNIVSQAEDIYTIGKNSWTTIEASFPEPVTKAYILDNELVIKYDTSRGPTEAVFFSDVPIQGGFSGGNISSAFHTGFMSVKIESLGSSVLISEVS